MRNKRIRLYSSLTVLLIFFSAYLVHLALSNQNTTDENQIFIPESANLAPESIWNGFVGFPTCFGIWNDFAFIGGSDAYSMAVVELSFFTVPTVVDVQYSSVENHTNDIAISKVGGYIYTASRFEGIIIYGFDDVTKAAHIMGNYTGHLGIHHIVVDVNLAFIIVTDNILVVLDITNPQSPSYLGEYDPDDIVRDLYYADNKVYLACINKGIVVIDVSTPSTPTYDTEYALTYAFDVIAVDNLIFVASYTNGLAVINTTGPTTHYFSTVQNSETLYYEDNIVYVGEEKVLELVNVTDITNMQNLNDVSIPSPGYIEQIFVDRDFIYYLDFSQGIGIFDSYDLFDITFTSEIPLTGQAYDVLVDGTTAYLTAWNYSLVILDILDPANPVPLGYYDSAISSIKVLKHNSYLFLLDGLGGFEIVNPTAPITYISYYSSSSFICYDMYIEGDYLYLATLDGFEIIDISDVFSPTLVSSESLYRTAKIFVNQNNLYALSINLKAVYAYDITNKQSITYISDYILPYSAVDMFYTNDKLAVIGGYNLTILDILNPSSISELGSQSYTNGVDKVYARNDICFIHEDNFGLRILNISNPGSITEIDVISVPNTLISIYATDTLLFYTPFPYPFIGINGGLVIYSYFIDQIPHTPTTTEPGSSKLYLWIGVGTT
ncbi:MAG: hypothetical protein FK733_14985 [Asgard group archaeon]|nr:hypothetical protein [Asgard group archaeon]